MTQAPAQDPLAALTAMLDELHQGPATPTSGTPGLVPTAQPQTSPPAPVKTPPSPAQPQQQSLSSVAQLTEMLDEMHPERIGKVAKQTQFMAPPGSGAAISLPPEPSEPYAPQRVEHPDSYLKPAHELRPFHERAMKGADDEINDAALAVSDAEIETFISLNEEGSPVLTFIEENARNPAEKKKMLRRATAMHQLSPHGTGESDIPGPGGLAGAGRELAKAYADFGPMRPDARQEIIDAPGGEGPLAAVASVAGGMAKYLPAFINPAFIGPAVAISAAKAAQDTLDKTGSPTAAIGSGTVTALSELGLFKVAGKFGHKAYENIGNAMKQKDANLVAMAIGDVIGGGAAGAGISEIAMAIDQLQQVPTTDKTLEEAWETIKDATPDTMAGGALSGAIISVGGAVHGWLGTVRGKADIRARLKENMEKAQQGDSDAAMEVVKDIKASGWTPEAIGKIELKEPAAEVAKPKIKPAERVEPTKETPRGPAHETKAEVTAKEEARPNAEKVQAKKDAVEVLKPVEAEAKRRREMDFAVRMKDGTIVSDPEAMTHLDLVESKSIDPEEIDAGGFVDPKSGEFISDSDFVKAVKPPKVEVAKPEEKAEAPAEPGDPKRAERMRGFAEGLTGKIDDMRRPMTQNPTPKRMREHGSRRVDADQLELGQRALNALAEAHEAGTVPAVLADVRTKTEIMALSRKETDSGTGYYDPPFILNTYADTSRKGKALQKLMEGAKTPKQSKADIEKTEARRIEELESKVQFISIPGFFPSPKPVIDRMMEAAEIEPGMSVLEPSAGKGDIMDAVRETAKPSVLTGFEINSDLVEIGRAKGHDVKQTDFLEVRVAADKEGSSRQYDRILMNPPFEKSQDVDHVRRAYEALAPGGRLVAIMSEGTFFRSTGKAPKFREWLDDLGGTSEKLEAGAFKGAFKSTGVAARMVVIDKPKIVRTRPQHRRGMVSLEPFEQIVKGAVKAGKWTGAQASAGVRWLMAKIGRRGTFKDGKAAFDAQYGKSDPGLFQKLWQKFRAFIRGLGDFFAGPGDTSRQATKPASPEAFDSLLKAVRSAKPARKEFEQMKQAERAKRGAVMRRAQEGVGGKEALFRSLRAQKGEFERPAQAFEPLADSISEAHQQELYDHVWTHKLGGAPQARMGLANVLRSIIDFGYMPTEGEILRLEQTFGGKFAKELLKKKFSPVRRAVRELAEIVTIPQSLLASWDISATGRQGLPLTVAYPKISAGAVKDQLLAFKSESFAQEVDDRMRQAPLHQFREADGLYLPSVRGTVDITAREEMYYSRIIQKIPILRALVRPSERAYITFLNVLRSQVYDLGFAEMERAGFSRENNLEMYKAWAKLINSGTGRGNFNLGDAGPFLNVLLWSPRLYISHVEFPIRAAASASKPVLRKHAARQFVATGAFVLSVAGLLKMISNMNDEDDDDVEVEFNPKSTQFLKAKIGKNTTIDLTGGRARTMAMLTQLFSGERETAGGREADATAPMTLWYYFKGKLSPSPSAVVSIVEGERFGGKELTVGGIAADLTVPITFQAIPEVVNEHGIAGLSLMAPEILGFGVHVFQPSPEDELRDYKADLKDKMDAKTASPDEKKAHFRAKSAITLVNMVKKFIKEDKIGKDDGEEWLQAYVDWGFRRISEDRIKEIAVRFRKLMEDSK